MARFVSSSTKQNKNLCFKTDTKKIDPLWGSSEEHKVFFLGEKKRHSQRAVGVMVSRAIKKVIIIRIYWTIFFTLHGLKARRILFGKKKRLNRIFFWRNQSWARLLRDDDHFGYFWDISQIKIWLKLMFACFLNHEGISCKSNKVLFVARTLQECWEEIFAIGRRSRWNNFAVMKITEWIIISFSNKLILNRRKRNFYSPEREKIKL